MANAVRPSTLGVKKLLDVDGGLVVATTEGDDTFDHGENGVIVTHFDTDTGLVLGTTLAQDDVAWFSYLAA